MGIDRNVIPAILASMSAFPPRGALLQLGRQDVTVGADELSRILEREGYVPRLGRAEWVEEGGRVTSETFFRILGYDRVDSLDYDPSEGAGWIFDLNHDAPPAERLRTYQAIFDGGTLEHIFDVSSALATCLEILSDDGTFWHLGPLNNYVDHGFYQFSPTLWFDWSLENGLVPIESVLIGLPRIWFRSGYWTVRPLPAGELGATGGLNGRPYLHWFGATLSARRDGGLTKPQQAVYARERTTGLNGTSIRHFRQFAVLKGRRLPGMTSAFSLRELSRRAAHRLRG